MAGKIDILVLEGDGIGPEITAATLAVLRAADAKFGLGLAFETAAIGWAAHQGAGTTFPDSVLEKAKAVRGRAAGAGVAQRLSAAWPKVVSIRPANCASGSISTPISVRRARAKVSRRAAARASISSSCARTPKVSTPTAPCISAPASSCRRPISRWPCARSRARVRRASRRPPSSSRMQRRKKVTAVHKANVLRVSDGLYLECTRAVAARYRKSNTRSASSTPWRRCWSATPASSTSSSPPICTATFCPTRRPRFPAASGWRLRSMPAPSTRWRRPSTARRPTSPARISPIRPR